MKPGSLSAPVRPTFDRGESDQEFIASLSQNLPQEIREDIIERSRIQSETAPRPSPTSVKVYFGSVATWTDRFPYVAMGQGDEEMFVLEKIGNEIAFSAKFFSQNGDIVCEIVRNEFHLNHDNIFRIERTDNTLKIFNKQAKLTVSVEYLNPTAIRFLGDFYLRNGRRIVMTENGSQFSPNSFIGDLVYPPQSDDTVAGLWIAPPPGLKRPFAIGIDVPIPPSSENAPNHSPPPPEDGP